MLSNRCFSENQTKYMNMNSRGRKKNISKLNLLVDKVSAVL
jgi:hypothetical protein